MQWAVGPTESPEAPGRADPSLSEFLADTAARVDTDPFSVRDELLEEIVQRRRRGDFAACAVLAPVLERLILGGPARGGAESALARIQLAATHQILRNHDKAIALAVDAAEDLADDVPEELTTRVRDGFATAGLSFAISGNSVYAERMLERVFALPAGRGEAENAVLAAAASARAIVLCDRLDPVGAGRELAAHPLPVDDERWAARLVAEWYVDFLRGRLDLAINRVAIGRSFHHRTCAPGSQIWDALAMVEAWTLIHQGRGNRARVLLDGLDEPIGLIGRLLLDLDQGVDPRLIAGRVDAFINSTDPIPRVRLQALLLLVNARLRAGQRDEARDALRLAVHTADEFGVHSYFVAEPETVLDLLHECGEEGRALHERVAGQRLTRRADSHGIILSERERTVLSWLATSLTEQRIAERLFVSVNTVRSQRRSLYAKLGVKTRAEAIEAGGRLGLIDPITDA